MNSRLLFTCKVLSSRSASGSGGRRARAAGAASSGARSQGADHCARCSRNRSFHAARSSTSWSPCARAWNGAKHRTHRTAMKSKRALVSYKIGNITYYLFCSYLLIINYNFDLIVPTYLPQSKVKAVFVKFRLKLWPTSRYRSITVTKNSEIGVFKFSQSPVLK